MFIGVDIGGTKCAVTIGKKNRDGSFEILEKNKISTAEYVLPEKILEVLAEDIEKLIFKYKEIDAIGISCGGPLDSENGVVLSPPNLPGWDNVYIVKFFEERFNIKTYLQNDANACALAEWKFGAARGLKNVIFLTFGTGMGAGLILDGRLYSGTNDMAGEVGHIRLRDDGPVGFGKSGSFEGFCSGGGIAKLGKEKARKLFSEGRSCGFCKSEAELESITAKSISESAFAGDADAIEVYKHSANMLGAALSILIDVLNPQMIVIGSVFTRAYDLMYDEVRRVIDSETIGRSNAVCKISKAELGEQIGDYAALSVAVNGFEGNEKND